MASQSSSLSLALVLMIMIIAPKVQAQTTLAPGPINVTAILEKGGQYQTLIRVLTATQIVNRIENQLNASDIGLTLFAPTDKAFNNLNPDTVSGLTTEQQVVLILYHVLPKYYSISVFEVFNPVRTQATGIDGGQFCLYFLTSGKNQVYVSSGIVTTQLNAALSQEFPLAVYSVDNVLLPSELFGSGTPEASPPAVYSVDDVLLPLDLFGSETPKASPPAASTVPSKKSPPTVAGEIIEKIWVTLMHFPWV